MTLALQLAMTFHMAWGDACSPQVLLQTSTWSQKMQSKIHEDTECVLKDVSFPNYDAPAGHPQEDSLLGYRFLSSTPMQAIVRKIFYINMDHSTDRKSHMEHMLSKLHGEIGIPYERVRALMPDEDPWVKQKMSIQNDPKGHLWGGKRPGSMSCFSNHLRALRQASKELNPHVGPYGHESFVLILEDDASLNSTILKKATMALADVPADVQILLLGWWGHARPQDSLNVNNTVYRVGGHRDPANGKMMLKYGGSHAYLVRNTYLEQVINFMDAAPMGYSADGGMLFHPECLRKYAVNPPLVGLQHSLSHKSERLWVERQSDARHAEKMR